MRYIPQVYGAYLFRAWAVLASNADAPMPKQSVICFGEGPTQFIADVL